MHLKPYYLVQLTHHDVLHKMIPDSTVKSKKLISLCQKKSTQKIFFIYDNLTNGDNFLTYFQAIPSLILTFYCRKHTWLTGQTLCRQLMDHFMMPLFNLMNHQTTSSSKRKHAHKPTINSPASVSLRYLLSFVIKLYKLNFFTQTSLVHLLENLQDVASQVDRLVANEILSAADVTERVGAELVNLPSELMQQISNEVSGGN